MSKEKLFNYELLRSYFFTARLGRDYRRRKYTGIRIYAKEMGVSKTTLARFILKDVALDMETVIRMCRWLNKPIDEFIIKRNGK